MREWRSIPNVYSRFQKALIKAVKRIKVRCRGLVIDEKVVKR